MPIQSTLSGRSSGAIKAEGTQSDGRTYEELRRDCLQRGVLFEDPDFPAADSSLFYSQAVPVQIEWKRPKVSHCGGAGLTLGASSGNHEVLASPKGVCDLRQSGRNERNLEVFSRTAP